MLEYGTSGKQQPAVSGGCTFNVMFGFEAPDMTSKIFVRGLSEWLQVTMDMQSIQSFVKNLIFDSIPAHSAQCHMISVKL